MGHPSHRVLLDNSIGVMPLEGRSAGFVLPGQCFQLLTGTRLLISSTRFWTNGFQVLLSPQIQNKATLFPPLVPDGRSLPILPG